MLSSFKESLTGQFQKDIQIIPKPREINVLNGTFEMTDTAASEDGSRCELQLSTPGHNVFRFVRTSPYARPVFHEIAS